MAARHFRQTGSFFHRARLFLRCGRNALIFRQCRFRFDCAAAGSNDVLRRDRIWQHIARDAVRGGRVEAVAGEERSRFGLRDDVSVKKRGAQRSAYFAQNSMSWLTMRIATPDAWSVRKICPKTCFELRVQALCRFVKKQNIRIQKQDFCQRRALLFAAGKVIRMAV